MKFKEISKNTSLHQKLFNNLLGRMSKNEKIQQKLFGICSDSSNMFNVENMDFKEAIHMLLHREKVSRNEKDNDANALILSDILKLCVQQKEWKALSECVVLIVGKHSCVQEAVQRFIQDIIKILDEVQERDVRLEMITSLRSACEGRLYLEREHVDVTKMLANMYEKDGEIAKAAEVLAGLKVDSYGLLTQREKVQFILLEMRLLIKSDQREKAGILSRKLQLSFFTDPHNEDLKIQFYGMKIELERWTSYLETSRHYWILSSCETLGEDLRLKMVINSAIFCALATKSHEQVVFTQLLLKEHSLKDKPMVCLLLKLLSSKELISAGILTNLFQEALEQTQVMTHDTRFGRKCFSDLNQRIIEHNILTIASYYSRIKLSRMAELIETSVQSCEENIAKLVTGGLMTARIDRFTGIVDFSETCVRDCVLNTWADTVRQAMECTNKVAHHVQKEVSLNDEKEIQLTLNLIE